jgi:hypothetical protein
MEQNGATAVSLLQARRERTGQHYGPLSAKFTKAIPHGTALANPDAIHDDLDDVRDVPP